MTVCPRFAQRSFAVEFLLQPPQRFFHGFTLLQSHFGHAITLLSWLGCFFETRSSYPPAPMLSKPYRVDRNACKAAAIRPPIPGTEAISSTVACRKR